MIKSLKKANQGRTKVSDASEIQLGRRGTWRKESCELRRSEEGENRLPFAKIGVRNGQR